MNNVELSAKVKSCLKGSAAKAKKFEDLVAVSISLLSENPEDMYVAVREGQILVDHYAYDDNNCSIEASAETIDKLFSGEMSFDDALADGYVKVSSGDAAKFWRRTSWGRSTTGWPGRCRKFWRNTGSFRISSPSWAWTS